MIPRDSDYFTTRPIGIGRSNAADVRRSRRALSLTGYGRFPARGSDRVTPGLTEAIQLFQTDFGLDPDGVIAPGGPTERALSVAVDARRQRGEPGVREVRRSFALMSDAGFRFRPDPRKPGAGQWYDEDGRVFSHDEAEEATRRFVDAYRTGARSPAEFDVAAVPLLVPLAAHGVRALLGVLVRRGAASRLLGQTGPGLAGRGSAQTLSRSIDPPLYAQRTDLPRSRADGADYDKEEVIHPEIHPDVPPYPAERPNLPGNREEFPAEPREPIVFVQPIPEQNMPGILIFPDDSELFNEWFRILESRGKEDMQQKDVKFVVECIHAELGKRGLQDEFDHIGGGYTADKHEYRKERVIKIHENAGIRGSKRSDIAYLSKKGGYYFDINVVDVLANNSKLTLRERQNYLGILENKKSLGQKGKTFVIGKSKNMEEKTWEKGVCERFIPRFVDIMEKFLDGKRG